MKTKLLIATLLLALLPTAWADRVKDVASVAAGRSNQLVGYGIVVGLANTGDGADVVFTVQSIKSMLNRMGITLEGPISDFVAAVQGGKLDVKNAAAVMVTAELPGFAKPGQRIDVNVSAMGKASSLRGGNLILTSLRGVDGQVYALAQGALTATGIATGGGGGGGGGGAGGGGGGAGAGSSVNIGVATSARIPSGAIVERSVDSPFESSDHVVLNTRESDFTTATAIVNAINKQFGEGTARAIDGMSIAVRAPEDLSQRVAFMSMVENLDVQPGEPAARVVVNSRTGTVVISRNVRVSAAAVAHGTISVAISATNEVSQPNPLSQGQTTPVQNAQVSVNEANNPMVLFQPGVDLRQIVDAVNQIGATPSALIAILEALKSSGSLRAELVVI